MRYIVRRIMIPREAGRNKKSYVLFNDSDYIYLYNHFWIYVEKITELGKRDIVFRNRKPLSDFIFYEVYQNEIIPDDTNVYFRSRSSFRTNFHCLIIAQDFGLEATDSFFPKAFLKDRIRKDFNLIFQHDRVENFKRTNLSLLNRN